VWQVKKRKGLRGSEQIIVTRSTKEKLEEGELTLERRRREQIPASRRSTPRKREIPKIGKRRRPGRDVSREGGIDWLIKKGGLC